jgi:hypothetical protein
MKKRFFSLALLIFLALPVCGQTPEAQKLEEFGTIHCDEYLARVDAILIGQANNPNAMIYVFIYEGKERQQIYKNGAFAGYKSVLPTYGTAKAKIESMKKYLKLRKQPVENYVFASGGFRADAGVEIWLVPPGAEPPKPTPGLKKIKYRKGKAQRFCLECC